jgi:hypothetical protein
MLASKTQYAPALLAPITGLPAVLALAQLGGRSVFRRSIAMSAARVAQLTRFCLAVGITYLIGCESDEGDPEVNACEAVCEQSRECDPDADPLDDCITGCNDSAAEAREEFSAACFDAQTDLILCVADLSCARRERWSEGDPGASASYPCKAQDLDLEVECEDEICDCSYFSRDCTITYDAQGRATEHCVCSPACCC